jgi:GT2 family glycosyltransferase
VSRPEVAVVIPSHDRPARLRRLLDALAEQTLGRDRFEVVVAHDSSGPETEELLLGHPLAQAGVLRHLTLNPGSGPPGANRNAAWRASRAPVVAFTDDDCRPPRDWLEKALAASARHPEAIVQGTTRPDPDEAGKLALAGARSQSIVPPTPYAQCCNMVYPRSVLDRLGGFEEDVLTGEDTDLAARARRQGVPHLAAPEVLTYHAVETAPLLEQLAALGRWSDLPRLVKRNPELRSAYPLGFFWKRTHAWLPLALAGLFLARRRPLWGVLALPWAVETLPQYGGHARGRLRSISELPRRLAIDVTEFAVLAWGSAKSRTMFL